MIMQIIKSLINLSNMFEEVRKQIDDLKEAYPNSGGLFDKSKLNHPIKDVKVFLSIPISQFKRKKMH